MGGAWSPAALVPGVWVLALGAALLAALARWFDPVPRRVAAVFALVVFGLFARVLVCGMVLLPLGNLVGFVPFRGLPPPRTPTHGLQADQVHEGAPWQAEVRRATERGRWPLWNEHAGVGMPLLADPQSQSFQPLVVAGNLLPLPASFGVTGALRVLVALVGMFLLLRRQGIREVAALLGSLGYGLAGALLLWLGWPIANGVAWTPFAAYAVVRCHRVGGRRDYALLAATLVALFLGGHPETVLQALAFVGLWVAACAWERRRAGRPFAAFLARCALAFVLAGLVVAPVLVLQQRYLPQTERAAVMRVVLKAPTVAQLQWGLQDLRAWREWQQRVEAQTTAILAAHAFGDHEGFWGWENFVEDGSGSIGAALAVLALAAALRRRGRLAQESAMTGGAAVCLLAIAQPPYFNRFLAQLPLLAANAVHNSHRLVLLLAFAAAYLAACEVERWLCGERRWRALVFAGASVAVALCWAYLGHLPPGAASLPAVQAHWLTVQLGAAVLVTIWVLAIGYAQSTWAKRTAPWAAAAVVALELVALHGEASTPGPARLFYPRTQPMRFLLVHAGEGRILGEGAALAANFAQVYGLNDVRVAGPSKPNVYNQLVAALRPKELNLGNLWVLEQPGASLYDLLGVRYILTRPRLQLPLPLASRHRSGWIYEHPRPLPRLFLPGSAVVLGDGSWQRWVAQPRDFLARSAVSAPPPGSSGERWHARRAASSRLTATRHEPARWSARESAADRRLLATSILQEGGWRVMVDGRPHAAVTTNGPLLGAWLPRGAHQVELLYRPPGFLGGCLATAAALAALLTLLLAPPGAARRAAPP